MPVPLRWISLAGESSWIFMRSLLPSPPAPTHPGPSRPGPARRPLRAGTSSLHPTGNSRVRYAGAGENASGPEALPSPLPPAGGPRLAQVVQDAHGQRAHVEPGRAQVVVGAPDGVDEAGQPADVGQQDPRRVVGPQRAQPAE